MLLADSPFEQFEDIYFHAWHFIYQQVQLTSWFGNIVAGLVTFLAVAILWPRIRKGTQRAIGVTGLHRKLDAQHIQRMRQAQAHHDEALALARSHHAEHMAALRANAPAPRAAKVVASNPASSPADAKDNGAQPARVRKQRSSS